MDLKKAKYHLKRIDTLINLHPDGLTPLDKDIIMEDIRRLYDVFMEWPQQTVSAPTNQSVQPEERSTNTVQPSSTTPVESNKIYSTPAVETIENSPIQQPTNPVHSIPSQPLSPPIPNRTEAPAAQIPPAHSPSTPPAHNPGIQSPAPHSSPASYQYSPAPETDTRRKEEVLGRQESVEEIKPNQPNTQQPTNHSPQPQYNTPSYPSTPEPIKTQASPIQYQKPEPQVTQPTPPAPTLEEEHKRAQYASTPKHIEEVEPVNREQNQSLHQDSTPSQQTNVATDSSQFSELFDVQSDSDLSGRLGNAKIENLNSVLGINDKILYINQLFGGEAIPFQEALKRFQSFYTYAEAKEFAISELVEPYQWSKPEKKTIVNTFMKQVRRLY